MKTSTIILTGLGVAGIGFVGYKFLQRRNEFESGMTQQPGQNPISISINQESDNPNIPQGNFTAENGSTPQLFTDEIEGALSVLPVNDQTPAIEEPTNPGGTNFISSDQAFKDRKPVPKANQPVSPKVEVVTNPTNTSRSRIEQLQRNNISNIHRLIELPFHDDRLR